MNRFSLVSITILATALAACLGADQLRRRQYEAQYRQAVQLCGHTDAAFQAGYNAGYSGDQMHADWTAMCVPDARQPAYTSYQSGFLQGANNAPIRVVHTVTPIRGHITTSSSLSASECTFDSDCGGGGWHCRDHTCMGYGYVGDRCVFNDDCATDHCLGGTCRE